MRNSREKIAALQKIMSEKNVQMYLVTTADFHQSEYVGDYFKLRAWLSGFTGSAGTLLVTKDSAYLWTDGRYFIQAAKQLEGSGISLMKMGEEGVPSVTSFIKEHLPEEGCLAFDGRTVSASAGKVYEELVLKKNGTILYTEDFGGDIWAERPDLSKKPIYLVPETYTGMNRAEKLATIRKEMKDAGANVHLLSSLDDIAWILNLRGDDIAYNPVALSYLMITMEKVLFFIWPEAVSDEAREELGKDSVEFYPYFEVYETVKNCDENDKILLQSSSVNYALYKNICDKTEIIDKRNPSIFLKGCKNPTEMENIRIAHLKDAKAMCRFIFWLKKEAGNGQITEYTAKEYSEKLRLEDKDCLDMSFETICAYGPNAAMCHYAPEKENCAKVEPKGFFLIDSGGQYWQGTTDITRTIAVGELTQEEKEHFTLVLQGHIRLAMAKFKYGCTGANLDYLARSPLWEHGLDFNHGTGHGVGYLLNVHEGPQTFHWHIGGARPGNVTVLEEGMLTSNEPGLYLEGEYGIRTENLLLCRKAEKTRFGQFMEFENVTFVPYDREAILPEMLSKVELDWLNAYHREVYEKVGPMLDAKEREWLLEATAEIK